MGCLITRKCLTLSTTVVFVSCCLMGFAYQLSLVSNLYFKYRTTTQIRIEIPKKIFPLAIGLCSRYSDHLDYQRIKAESRGRRNWYHSFDSEIIRRYQHDLFIDEIFKYTPDPRTTLSGVMFRVNSSYEGKEFYGQEVYRYFNIRKYIYIEYICYEFAPSDPVMLAYSSLSVTPASSGTAYMLQFNRTLYSAAMLKIVIYGQGLHAYRSLSVSPVLRRYHNYNNKGRNRVEYNVYNSYVKKLWINHLPPPYDSRCFDYTNVNLSSHIHCTQRCVKQKVLSRFGKLPFTTLIFKPTRKRMISYLDVLNPKISKELFQMQEHCEKNNCSRVPCRDITTLATTIAKAGSEFLVRKIVPSEPDFNVQVRASLTLIEFLTYVLSAVSTWTGISIMFLNPVTVVTKLRVEKKRRDRLLRHKQLEPVIPVLGKGFVMRKNK